MEQAIDSSLWILLLIPLIIGASIGILYLLAQSWNKKARAEIAPLSSELRSLENQYRRLSLALSNVSAQDPEPYGSLAKTLQDRLAEAETQLLELRRQYVSIQERMPRKSSNPLESVIGGPFILYKLRQEIASLHQNLSQQQGLLSNAIKAEQSITRAAAIVAVQARQAKQIDQGTSHRLDDLKSRGIHGQNFQDAERQEEQFQARLASLPGYLFNGSEAQVIAQGDKETIIQACQLLADLRPGQEGLFRQIQTWDSKLAGIQEIAGEARQGIDAVAGSLEAMPAGLDLTAERARHAALDNSLQSLTASLNRPGVEQLDRLAVEVERLVQSSYETGSQLRQIRHAQAALEQSLSDLVTGLKQVTTQYTVLGTSKVRPITWKSTSATLSRLNQQVNALGTIQKVRTPELVEQDLNSANQLLAQEKELAITCQQAASQHAELLSILESTEINQGILWAQSTQKLLGQLQEYSSDNWLRADAVSDLPDELKRWMGELQRLASGSPAQSIPEDQLAGFLEDSRRLAQDGQALRVRFNAIETRLTALQQTENQARDQLDLARKTLMQVGYILRSNLFLSPLTGPEAERLQNQVERLAGELELRGQGTVEYKARQVGGLAARIETGMNGWLDRLSQDTQAKVKSLTASLTRLDSIAPLDDSPLADAHRLLSSGQPYGGSQKSQFPLDKMVMEFKQRSDYHQSCTSAERALEDLEKPVVESFNAANVYRQQVHDSIGEFSASQRQGRAWPPSSVSLDAEHQEFGRVEEQWQMLKDQPVRAIDLVARLGDLSARYQSLAEKLRQEAQRTSQEQAQVQTLERDLDDYLRLWDRQWQAHQDKALTTEEIRDLLTSAENEHYRIQTQYKEGKTDYTQAVQALQSLVRRVRLFQAALDDSHVVDVNGQVITSRDSKRTAGEW